MKNEEKRELIKYRISKAKETLDEIPMHLENALWNTAANRLYYACFYAAIALLLDNDIETKTHAGVKQQLGLHIIVPGILDKEMGKFYTYIFNLRQKGDYDDFVVYEEENVAPLLEPATAFINKIAELLAA